jgi:hypothetical protein
MAREIGPFHDYETNARFFYEDGKIFKRGGRRREVWPDGDCICLVLEAEYDPLSGALYVTFERLAGCTVHT